VYDWNKNGSASPPSKHQWPAFTTRHRIRLTTQGGRFTRRKEARQHGPQASASSLSSPRYRRSAHHRQPDGHLWLPDVEVGDVPLPPLSFFSFGIVLGSPLPSHTLSATAPVTVFVHRFALTTRAGGAGMTMAMTAAMESVVTSSLPQSSD
jgi:hypothetical protein